MLPFHYHRRCTHMNFATVLGMDVLQHCLSGQRSWVSNASFKVLDAFCVSAGTTDEPRTPIISTDAVHVAPAYTRSSGVRVINFTCWLIGIVIRCGTNALGTAHQRSLALTACTPQTERSHCRQHFYALQDSKKRVSFFQSVSAYLQVLLSALEGNATNSAASILLRISSRRALAVS